MEPQVASQNQVPETVAFTHKFFTSVPGIYFFKDELKHDFLVCMPLDGKTAHLPALGLKHELHIPEGSADDVMLQTISEALEYVTALRVGDKIPSEVLSGKASWEVNEKHRKTANSRLSMQLVGWMTGDEEVMHDATQLEMIADDPAMRSKVNTAFEEAAEALGFPRSDKEKVIELINDLAEELSFIEALRCEFEHIETVEKRIIELSDVYASDRTMSETLLHLRKLCSEPMAYFRNKFEEIDAQTGEIIAVLKNVEAQIVFIRGVRDDLFKRFRAWDAIATKWSQTPPKRSRGCEALVQETYRFLAQRFLPQKEWDLFCKAQDNAAKANTESVWA